MNSLFSAKSLFSVMCRVSSTHTTASFLFLPNNSNAHSTSAHPASYWTSFLNRTTWSRQCNLCHSSGRPGFASYKIFKRTFTESAWHPAKRCSSLDRKLIKKTSSTRQSMAYKLKPRGIQWTPQIHVISYTGLINAAMQALLAPHAAAQTLPTWLRANIADCSPTSLNPSSVRPWRATRHGSRSSSGRAPGSSWCRPCRRSASPTPSRSRRPLRQSRYINVTRYLVRLLPGRCPHFNAVSTPHRASLTY